MSFKKVGRPLSDNPKNKEIEIRTDKEFVVKLDEVAKKLNTTRSDIARKGIEKLYDDLFLPK